VGREGREVQLGSGVALSFSAAGFTPAFSVAPLLPVPPHAGARPWSAEARTSSDPLCTHSTQEVYQEIFPLRKEHSCFIVLLRVFGTSKLHKRRISL